MPGHGRARRRKEYACLLAAGVPRFELLHRHAVIHLEWLVDPGAGGKVLHRIIRGKGRNSLGPEYGAAQVGDGGIPGAQHVDHRLQCFSGIGQIVHQQHTARNLAFGRGDVVGDVQVALLGAVAVALRSEDLREGK